ncbi:MAG TPA: SRPBCC family protein [Pirellulales bacterium]|jgi:hypothetical protein|nr:SRPBCC family protein [Pirellulales bacterium]
MFKKILIALVLLLAAFAGAVAMQPDELHVERSATIAAEPAAVFAQVNDFHRWQEWSPWTRLDPEAKNSFEGPEAGKGAIFRWAGNAQVGEGSMTIVESRPDELIRIHLEFVKPFEGTNNVLFTFKPEGDGTLVTWDMLGKKNFVCKAMCLVMNMQKMIGSEFDQGLANLKGVVEQQKPAG